MDAPPSTAGGRPAREETPMVETLSIRVINRLIVTGKQVVATYTLDGRDQQGRIIRARLHQGVTQCKTIDGQWALLRQAWQA
jgi:hypothetical protein